jgi:hypothetical protein
MDERIDKIFCKMLNYDSASLGCTDSPYLISKDIIQAGLIDATLPIMKHLRDFIMVKNENRMIVFNDQHGTAIAILNTTRVSLDGSRTIDWVEMPFGLSIDLPGGDNMLNPIWVTTYRQSCF